MIVTGMITKAVHKSSEEEKKEEEVKKTLEQHDNIVTQYKELIREQVNTAVVCFFFCVFSMLFIFDVLPPVDYFILIVRSSGCSDPGAERAGIVHVISDRTDADYHHPAAVPDPAAQRSVQHPQAKIRWVQLIARLLTSSVCPREETGIEFITTNVWFVN